MFDFSVGRPDNWVCPAKFTKDQWDRLRKARCEGLVHPIIGFWETSTTENGDVFVGFKDENRLVSYLEEVSNTFPEEVARYCERIISCELLKSNFQLYLKEVSRSLPGYVFPELPRHPERKDSWYYPSS